MKKVGIMLVLILSFVLGACTQDNDIQVSISNDIDKYTFTMSSARGITLTPVIEGKINKKIVYHWSTDDHTQQFLSLDGEQTVFTNEITNEGDPVLFAGGPGSGTSPVQITLSIKEKNTDNVLATTELMLTRNKGGFYIVNKDPL